MIRPLVVAALLPCLAAWSGSWQEIHRTADGVRAVQGEFVQEKHLPILAQPLVSQGTFGYRRPGDIRWEYTSPLRSLVLQSKDEIHRYIHQDGRFVPDAFAQFDVMRVVLSEIGRWLAGRFEESTTFKATLQPGKARGGEAVVTLTPRDAAIGRFITRIEISLAPTPGVIDQVVIHEGPQAYTVIRFRNVKLLPTLPDSLFRLGK